MFECIDCQSNLGNKFVGSMWGEVRSKWRYRYRTELFLDIFVPLHCDLTVCQLDYGWLFWTDFDSASSNVCVIFNNAVPSAKCACLHPVVPESREPRKSSETDQLLEQNVRMSFKRYDGWHQQIYLLDKILCHDRYFSLTKNKILIILVYNPLPLYKGYHWVICVKYNKTFIEERILKELPYIVL